MSSDSLAEFLIRFVEGRDRAAALVGDLVEIAQARGRIWFGFAVLRLLIARLWCPVVATIAALYACNWLLFASSISLQGVHAYHRPPEVWMPFFQVVSAIGAVLCGSMLYSAIRYGLNDLYTRLAFVVACLCIFVTFAWWLPGVLYAGSASLLALLVFSGLRAQRRWVLLTAGVTVVSAFSAFLCGLFALDYYQHAILHLHLLGDRELAEHPSLNWLGFALYVVNALIIAAICSFMHRHAPERALRIAEG
jgi:hypothetical protein